MLQPSPRPRAVTPRRSSATANHQAYPFSAPLGGIDVSQPMPGGNPLTALRLENFVPRTLGCQLRKGYRHWVRNLAGEVESLMDFRPASGAGKLLAATSTGAIYDVTATQVSSFIPVALLTVAGGQPPGEWTSFNFVTDVGVHVLVMINPGGGYWTYDGTTFTHHLAGAGVGEIDGTDPDEFVFATVYKKRIWFVQGGSTKAWYLPVGQIAGVVTEFDFGALMPHGGALDVLINWTMDGSSGVGVNNQLVAVTTEGDVIIYSGDDPDEASTFRIVGRWFIGRVPVGRRYFSEYATDVIILSERGMCFLSEIMRGQGFFENVQVAQAVNSQIASEVSQSLDTRYWEVVFLPHEQLILINRAEINTVNLQWAYEVNNKAFSTLVGMPMNTIITFNGRSFMGDLAGTVWWAFEGSSDGAVDAVQGTDLEGVVVTSFQPVGDAASVKRFHMVRPSFIAAAPPGVLAVLNSQWNLAAPGTAPVYLAAGENLWNVGLWNVAVWSGEAQSYEAWAGATGTGRYAALAMRVRGPADTIFVGWQALVEQGGIL